MCAQQGVFGCGRRARNLASSPVSCVQCQGSHKVVLIVLRCPVLLSQLPRRHHGIVPHYVLVVCNLKRCGQQAAWMGYLARERCMRACCCGVLTEPTGVDLHQVIAACSNETILPGQFLLRTYTSDRHPFCASMQPCSGRQRTQHVLLPPLLLLLLLLRPLLCLHGGMDKEGRAQDWRVRSCSERKQHCWNDRWHSRATPLLGLPCLLDPLLQAAGSLAFE